MLRLRYVRRKTFAAIVGKRAIFKHNVGNVRPRMRATTSAAMMRLKKASTMMMMKMMMMMLMIVTTKKMKMIIIEMRAA